MAPFTSPNYKFVRSGKLSSPNEEQDVNKNENFALIWKSIYKIRTTTNMKTRSRNLRAYSLEFSIYIYMSLFGKVKGVFIAKN